MSRKTKRTKRIEHAFKIYDRMYDSVPENRDIGDVLLATELMMADCIKKMELTKLKEGWTTNAISHDLITILETFDKLDGDFCLKETKFV